MKTDTHRGRFIASCAFVFVTTILSNGCGGVPPQAPPAPASAEWRAFHGEWTAVGHRRVLELGGGRRASIGEFNGHLRLTGPQRPNVGFNAQAVVFNDSSSGMMGRAVWTDERGDKVFCELRGEGTTSGATVKGTIFGGTGRYEGVTGEYEFKWEFVLEGEDGTVQGKSAGFTGRFRLPANGGRS